ncbi:MAG: hypothetical protein WBD58_23430 [Geitlerinemataceae cyanobacterium]
MTRSHTDNNSEQCQDTYPEPTTTTPPDSLREIIEEIPAIWEPFFLTPNQLEWFGETISVVFILMVLSTKLLPEVTKLIRAVRQQPE